MPDRGADFPRGRYDDLQFGLTDELLRSQVKPPGPPFDVVIPISITSPGTRLLQDVVIRQISWPFWVLLIN